MLMLKVWGIGIALMILCEWIENPDVIVPSPIFFIGLPIAIYLIYKVFKQLDSRANPVLPKEEAAMPDEEDLSDMLGAESARFYGRESQEIDYYARSTQFRPSYNDVKQELKKTTSAGKQSGYHTENRNGLAHDSMPKESQQNASVLNGEIITDMFSYQMCQVDGWRGIEITSYNGFDEKRITIPEKLEQYEVIKIGSYAFRNTELEEIVCPDTILEIGDEAFSGCKNLIQINIPDSVRRIGMWAFSYCESLSVVVLPNSLTKLELGAFSSSGIEQIVFPSSLRRDMPIEQVIERHTMFPYYARFLSRDRRRQAMALIVQMDQRYHNLLYLTKRKTIMRYLRYCQLCSMEDRGQYGETYWHRIH